MKAKPNYPNRDSNIELLRIIAMFGILVVHSDFFALGAPSADECTTSPMTSLWRFTIESFTIVSVNLFVLISGWFGIHPKRKRLSEFLFQIIFFNILLFCVFSYYMPEFTLTRNGIESIFILDGRFWFVKAYLLLYFLSPLTLPLLSATVIRDERNQHLCMLTTLPLL